MDRYTTKSILGGWTLKVPRQKAVDRLAAYENTGLTPEQAKDWSTLNFGPTLAKCCHDELDRLCNIVGGIDRLRELAEADKDGRCVIMPCKVGCKIWTIENVFNGKETVQTLGSRVIDEIKHNKLNENTMISKRPFELHFYPSEVGKTVFLTRKAAESALEAHHA